VRTPRPDRVPQALVEWPRASRLLPARFQAVDCFERVLDPHEPGDGDILTHLSDLTAAAGVGDLSLMDPAQVLFGTGAGWINPSFTAPRAARFSTSSRGAFYLAEDIETCVEEVRHHLAIAYQREGVKDVLEVDYRALVLHLRGNLHDIRTRPMTRAPWSAIYAPDSYAASQAFAASLRSIGSNGIASASVRKPGGMCSAIFEPNILRSCRHDTWLAFRWDGAQVRRIVEKRIFAWGC